MGASSSAVPLLPPSAPAHPVGRGSMAILRRDGVQIVLTDFDTAIYVYEQEVPLVSAVEATRNQTQFAFYDPDGRVEQLAVDFANTPEARYASAGHRLKRVIVRLPRDGGGGGGGSGRR